MLRIARERIERAFRAAWWREWRSASGLVWLVVVSLIVLVIVAYAWVGRWPMHELPMQHGRLVEMTLSEGDTGAIAYVSVRLSDGEIVTVLFPGGLMYRRGAAVELHCFSRDGPFHRRVCAFRRYLEGRDATPR